MDKSTISQELPEVLSTKTVVSSRIFSVEAVELRFSNKQERTFERLAGGGRKSVLVVPIDQDELIMVREYAVGREAYELGFVKGLIDAGETAAEAANRELQEEIGMAAGSLEFMRTVSVAPHYNCMQTDLYIGRGLFASQLEGDEPEPLLVERWPIKQIPELLRHPDISDSRVLFALSALNAFTDL